MPSREIFENWWAIDPVLRMGKTGQPQVAAIPSAEAMAERIPENEPGPTPTRISSGFWGAAKAERREGTKVAVTVPVRVPE
jgi:hypothetical protein